MAAARRRLGCDRRASGKLHYRDEQGELDLPLPAPAGPPSGDERRARRRDAAPPGQCSTCPTSALSAAMGWADWPARLQHLAPGPLRRRPRSLARRRPQSLGRAADRRAAPSTTSPTASRCTSSSPASRPRIRRACSSRSRASPRTSTRCRSPTTRASRPDELARDRGRARLPGRRARQTSSEALAAVPADARVLIFGSLYLAGEVSPPTIRCPTRPSPARRPSAPCPASRAPALGGDAHPFEHHEQDREGAGGRGPAEHGRIAVGVERLARDAAAERADQEGQRRQQRILHRGELLADDARQIGDERRSGDAGRDILVADREQQPHHPLVEPEPAEQRGRADSACATASMFGAALGEVGVNEIAEHRQDRADQHRREPPDPREQIAAEAIPIIVMKMPNTFDANATSSFV